MRKSLPFQVNLESQHQLFDSKIKSEKKHQNRTPNFKLNHQILKSETINKSGRQAQNFKFENLKKNNVSLLN